MAYDIAKIYQAFYIASEECMSSDMEGMTDEQTFRTILIYCNAFTNSLLASAGRELWERGQEAHCALREED